MHPPAEAEAGAPPTVTVAHGARHRVVSPPGLSRADTYERGRPGHPSQRPSAGELEGLRPQEFEHEHAEQILQDYSAAASRSASLHAELCKARDALRTKGTCKKVSFEELLGGSGRRARSEDSGRAARGVVQRPVSTDSEVCRVASPKRTLDHVHRAADEAATHLDRRGRTSVRSCG